MQLVVYDGSFEGFLSSVFDIYEYKFSDVQFAAEENYQRNIFGNAHIVNADEVKVKRLWKGLEQRLTKKALGQLYKTFLSEKKGIENILLAYIRYAFESKNAMEYDYSHAAVLEVVQMARIVYREKHRMEAFIRFQLTKDNLFYAVIEPDFNVLPLIKKHFHDRYQDQYWMIYDTRRKYGLYYDMKEVSTVSMSFEADTGSGKTIRSIYDGKEELYQKLWQQYFNSVNIAARKNMRLHIQHMPKRYWRFLTEKSVIT